MKGRVIKQKNVTTKYERRMINKFSQQKEYKMDAIEMLAKMWMQCDPNRMGDNPDDPIAVEGGTMNGQPKWKWFVARAEASLKFFDDNGLKLVKK